MVSLKNKKGFTIVELLIVIVIIGILATLVIVTFTGIQQKGRNTQRTTDIKALNGYIESFYAEYGFYPTVADMQSPDFVARYMKGLDPQAMLDPKVKQPATGTTGMNVTNADGYGYEYTPEADSDGTCSTSASATGATDEPADTGCTKYTVATAKMEGSAPIASKSSN